MDKKQIRDNAKSVVDDIYNKIEVLEKKYDDASKDGKKVLDEKMKELKKRRDEAKKKFDELEKAGEGKVNEAKKAFDEASKSFKDGFEKLGSVFKS